MEKAYGKQKINTIEQTQTNSGHKLTQTHEKKDEMKYTHNNNQTMIFAHAHTHTKQKQI